MLFKLFILTCCFFFQTTVLANCGDYIKVPFSEKYKEELKHVLSVNGATFEQDISMPFDICKDNFKLNLRNDSTEIVIDSSDRNRDSTINFIIDNSQKNDSRYKFYLEIDKIKYLLKNRQIIILSVTQTCSNNPTYYINENYVDLYGFRKLSHGHCPERQTYLKNKYTVNPFFYSNINSN